MKKLLIIGLFLLVSQLQAKLALGVNANSVSTMVDGEQRNSSLSFYPYVGIFTGELLEINPILGIAYDTEMEELQSMEYGLGVGFYFHFINKDLASVSLGPKLFLGIYTRPNDEAYDSYSVISPVLSAPLNIDIFLTSVFGMRLSSPIVELDLGFTSYETSSGISGDYSSTSIRTRFSFTPSYTLFFKF